MLFTQPITIPGHPKAMEGGRIISPKVTLDELTRTTTIKVVDLSPPCWNLSDFTCFSQINSVGGLPGKVDEKNGLKSQSV